MTLGVRHGMGFVVTALVATVSCTRSSTVGGAPPSENTPPLSQSVSPPPEVVVPTLPSGEWADAVRQHRWHDAEKLLGALPARDTERSDIKFVRARVAVELRQHARAVTLLDKLTLPALDLEVTELRAKAQLEAGPFEPAARHYAKSNDSERLTLAAVGFERAKLFKDARIAADRAVVASGLGKKKKKNASLAAEAAARAVRARVFEALDDKESAAGDLRWLATYTPTSDAAKGVDDKIATLSPKRALDKRERFTRALELAEAGRVADVERELSLIDGSNGAEVTKAERLHARGWALYTARDYEKAADLLEQSGKLGSNYAAHDAYYAAHARSRAQQDERAIEMYQEVAQRFRNSSFAENARFRSARLFYVMGRWKEAARSYATYLAKHGKDGRFLEQARFEQAIAWLAGGEPARAAKALGALADEEKSEHETAMLRELSALALAKAGKKDAAIAAFKKVIIERPLSFPALAAMARLTELGASLPPLIEPGKAGAHPGKLSVELPPKARLLHALGLDADAEREIADSEEAIRRSHAPRGDEALCRLYGELSEAGRRYRVGQRAARWSELDRAPAADNRWLWECVYPRPYEPLVRAAETEQTLPVDLLYAVMRQESGFATGVVSPAKAVGLLQLIPPTAANVAKELSLEYDPLLLSSPDYNIRLGAHYLRKVLQMFGDNVALAAAAYNAGPRAVSRWLEKGEELPLDIWVARIPYDETRNYVMRVIGNQARYAYLSGGESAVPKLGLELPKGLRAAVDAY
jgi:soluble lytic murein transglycosylase